MSVILHDNLNGSRLLVSKGAVEEMGLICSKIQTFAPDGTVSEEELTEEVKEKARKFAEELNTDGLRVVAVSYKNLSFSEKEFSVKDEKDLVFCGFLAFLDPPKETTAPALVGLMKHGITVKVLTGDSPLVCKKVCEQVGLSILGIVTTADLKKIPEDDEIALHELVKNATIFAKLTPSEKARVVTSLKRNGHVVGFLGDGINDAVALKSADVGISVDTAVDVAKEAADIIMLEKDLLLLVKGVIVGRVTYGNTIKYIKMAISSNFGNVFSVLVASAWLPYLPMLSVQLLTQNLLYDFSQLAIPWDNMDEEFILKPRNWNAKSILKFMVCIGPLSSIFDMTTFSFMWFYYGCTTPAQASLMQSAWFTEGLVTQTLIVHMIRTNKIPFIQSRASLPLIVGTSIVIALGIVIPFSPLKGPLQMEYLPGMYYPYLLGVLLGYCAIVQLGKVIYVRVFHQWMD